MGLREGWTKERVENFMMESKELQKLAAELDMIVIPTWLDEDGMRENLIEQYMVKEPELSEEEMMKEIEEDIKWSKENMDDTEDSGGPGIYTGEKQYNLALTDPDALREDLTMQRKRVYPDKDDKQIEKEVEKQVENLKIGVIRRLERMKKIEAA